MELALIILIGFLSASGSFAYMEFYSYANRMAEANEKSINYRSLKNFKRVYRLLFLIGLPVACYMAQFFDYGYELNSIVNAINAVALIVIILEIIKGSFQKNYIAMLQSKLLNEIEIKYIFDFDYNIILPEKVNQKNIYFLIKKTIYYNNDRITVALKPKLFNQKESMVIKELAFICDQLNMIENEFNENVAVKSFYKHPELYNFSNQIVYDELQFNKFRKFINKIYIKIENSLNTVFSSIYLLLAILLFVFGVII